MTLSELRYIVAVARERHFGHAAESCFVSQPTLSVAVKKLEEELGVGLFERGQGEVSLTPAGERIIAQAQRVLEEAGVIRELASQSKDQLSGPLRVGAIYTIGPYLLPHLVPILAQKAMSMPLIIRENFTSILNDQLKQGELDVIVISYPFEEPGIQTRPLYDEGFSVLLPNRHPLAAMATIQPEQLKGENVLLLGDGHCFRDQVLRICPGCLQKSAGDGGLQRNLEGGSLETIRYMVASGIGITVLPDTAIGLDQMPWDLLTARPLAVDNSQRRIALAWRKSFPRPEAINLLWESIRACDLSGVSPVEEPLTIETAVG
ncbi:MAG: hydrogen peroxide-inducible genes activator [Candidatus Thiodiazotropha sp. (ex Semelilucina semeliformis)]|nr:hydrogen peroxide-inducible genes activator [Candidatus Thiodiazotropha sp. (ex Myrtea spinifera)]MCU7808671.1 hydrogen peroxide-inducible genes activator [Candidatus Thiodiazotropha sp. (ex Semelilucina semeliformis)]